MCYGCETECPDCHYIRWRPHEESTDVIEIVYKVCPKCQEDMDGKDHEQQHRLWEFHRNVMRQIAKHPDLVEQYIENNKPENLEKVVKAESWLQKVRSDEGEGAITNPMPWWSWDRGPKTPEDFQMYYGDKEVVKEV